MTDIVEPAPDADWPLVERTIAGDQRAYGLLVLKYQRRIQRLVGRMVRDVDLVEDITQETFIRAYRALHQFRGDAQFYTWLYRIAVNTAKKSLLELKRDRTISESFFARDEEDETSFRQNEPSSEETPETVLAAKRRNPGGTTAVSCCGANPGMVSWFVKQGLVNVANELGIKFEEPDQNDREGWAKLMKKVGVKGVHIAERDTQRTKNPKPLNVFWNTWSVEGFISEGLQPAELGWGTHENWMPKNAKKHKKGCKAAIYLEQPGANTRVRTWCPTPGPQYGFLVTHNESISIADYFTVEKDGEVTYRPTCHYAYHPCNDAILSLHEINGAGQVPEKKHILTADEIVSGGDDLGVFLYGHAKGAMWYGSRLTIDEARALAPYQNATGMQVTSAVLAAMVWAAENPNAGWVEADEMDHDRCLAVQRPYLGRVECHYTDWTPIQHRINSFAEDRDADPWQFTNFLAV